MKNWIANETTSEKHKVRRWQLLTYLELIIIVELVIMLLLK
ncbi:hypothetical protein [Enterococcus cecorum]|nr:hypothetical protein [Enterococcus cecorum]CAI3427782.1 hypothetical protein CIRMBP1313_01035 [Enterococcus cecorum]